MHAIPKASTAPTQIRLRWFDVRAKPVSQLQSGSHNLAQICGSHHRLDVSIPSVTLALRIPDLPNGAKPLYVSMGWICWVSSMDSVYCQFEHRGWNVCYILFKISILQCNWNSRNSFHNIIIINFETKY